MALRSPLIAAPAGTPSPAGPATSQLGWGTIRMYGLGDFHPFG